MKTGLYVKIVSTKLDHGLGVCGDVLGQLFKPTKAGSAGVTVLAVGGAFVSFGNFLAGVADVGHDTISWAIGGGPPSPSFHNLEQGRHNVR